MSKPDNTDHIACITEANAPNLLSYFYRRVEVAEDAADLLSETLLVVWRRAADVPQHPDEARMWLYGVARKVLSTHNRASERRSALHDRLREQLATTSYLAPDPDLDVAGAVRMLAPGDQELIRLIFWDGFTQAQVAKHLDLPEGTVRSRTHRARQRLREVLRMHAPA